MRILQLLETAPQRRYTLTEIAERLDLPKSSTLNICMELVKGEFLRRTEDGYQLGRRLVQLGSAYVSSVDLVREFYDVCRQAPDDLDAMIQLAVLDEHLGAIYLARQDCASGLRLGLRAEIGRQMPANCTAAGKALLAALDPAEVERRLEGLTGLPTLTGRSISSPRALGRALDEVRKDGFATDDEEVLPGVACVAVAGRTSHRDGGLLAVSITAAKSTIVGSRADVLRTTTFELAAALQSRL